MNFFQPLQKDTILIINRQLNNYLRYGIYISIYFL